jgi:hypothetical protein
VTVRADAPSPPRRDRRRRAPWRKQRSGRQRLVFDVAAGLLLGAFVSAWAVSSVAADRERPAPGAAEFAAPAVPAPARAPAPASAVRRVGASLMDPQTKSTAYLDDAVLKGLIAGLRGESGKLKAAFRPPNADLAAEADEGLSATYEGQSGKEVAVDKLVAPADPGVYKLAVQLGKVSRPIEDLRIITMVPFTEKKNERIGLYYLGSWPYESGGKPRLPTYANPAGFVEVTQSNRATPVSEHFKLGDFLTKDQYDVWPKYVLLDPKLLDKLELTIEELQKEGHPVEHVFVMSGFRTPRYNKSGGNPGGRASLSRHMYGDASDVYVDNDRDGQPDDVNGDGRVDREDAKVFADAAEKVEQRHPALVGGIGIYKACCGHGPFTHIDTRGYRARWYGEGAG